MEFADYKFECGRKKGKTYEMVRRTDNDFCQQALNCTEESRFYPEEFKQFLRAFEPGYKVIKEIAPYHFLKQLNPDQYREFRKIITKHPYKSLLVERTFIHEPIDMDTLGFLEVFLRLFFMKCVLYWQQKVGYSGLAEEYAAIFPFKISSNVDHFEIPVKTSFEDRFKNEVNDFLVSHFDNIDSEATVDLFLRNIKTFARDQNFDEMNVAELSSFIEKISEPSSSTTSRCHDHEYFKTFPRLSNAGINRYTYYCKDLYEEIGKSYGFPISPIRSSQNYFRYLPEYNVHEILSLLDQQLYCVNYDLYLQRFLQYIFFFVHAERSSKMAIFFIDDFLFESLKYLQTFKTCLNKDPIEQKNTVAMLAAVEYRGKKKKSINVKTSDSNLTLILDYVRSRISNTESAVWGEEIKTDFIQYYSPFRVEDTFYGLSCSTNKSFDEKIFNERIVQAAFHTSTIRKIVRYNPKRGFEFSLNVPEKVEEIRNFVAKYNKYDFSVELPKEQFLTWGLEKYFQKDTIDWAEKYRQT